MSKKIQYLKREFSRRLMIVGALFLFVNVYSTLGFFLIEDATLFESFYMAVITISTVGYGEVLHLSSPGRVFAITSIYVGLISTGISVGLLTQVLFQRTIIEALRGRRMERVVSKMRNHFIVCGYGTTGRQVIEELLAFNEKVVLIDVNPIDLPDDANLSFYQGDARKDEILIAAQIEHAKGLVSVLTEDANNVFVVLTARSLNPNLKIVSRFKDDDTERKLKAAGVDVAISPYRIGGKRLASSLTNPLLTEFFEASLAKTTLGVHFSQIDFPQDSPILGKTIKDSGIREHSRGALIVGVIDDQGNSVFNPNPDYLLDRVKKLLILGDDHQTESLVLYLKTG